MTTKVTGMMSTGTKGGDIPSASTLVIDTDGDYFDITGTTGITAMTVAAGRRFTLQFDGAVTLTHGGSLYIPGAVNFTTEANDSLDFIATAANTVRCTGYALKDGGSIVAPAAGLSSQQGVFTKNIGDATGTTSAVTGVGFRPTCIFFFAGGSSPGAGYASWGFADSDAAGRSLVDYNNVSSGTYDVWTDEIRMNSSHPNRYRGNITSYDADGFTIYWTKDNTMSGSISINYLALK